MKLAEQNSQGVSEGELVVRPFEYHVSKTGNDQQRGDSGNPLKTISAAAARAVPSDTIIIHAGIYRERIDPPRGGSAEDRRITYRAAHGEEVSIRGSEVVDSWNALPGGLWQVRLPNSYFGTFNPYREKLSGHWFKDLGRDHHPGAVYLNGHWLVEAETFEDLQNAPGEDGKWFSHVDDQWTTLWARFNEPVDPNEGQVEINVRQSVFYPSRPGLSYITVQDLDLRQAASPWCPPTTEQIALIGTHWGFGWIIENNRISYATCCGVTLGKSHDVSDNGDGDVYGTAGADTYYGTILRATGHGWEYAKVGGHLVNGNHISHCEQAGIAGSLGCINSVVSNNIIHDIHVRRAFAGEEQAGIKFHAALDTEIVGNRIFRCNRGLWLDWMTQGTRVRGNLFYENGPEHDLFVEVNHGPYTVDHNVCLSERSLLNCSQGGAFVHNLFAGEIVVDEVLNRSTPYHDPRSTRIAGRTFITAGDDRWINNLLIGAAKLPEYPEEATPCILGGNERLSISAESLIEVGVEGEIHRLRDDINLREVKPCDAEELGETKVSGLPFYGPAEDRVSFGKDFFSTPREAEALRVGPFAKSSYAALRASQ